MEEQRPRKLAVVLHADVVGSTALVQRHEATAHHRIQDAFRRFSETIRAYGGVTHELRGDALVAEFVRTSDAVLAALSFQCANAEHNLALSDDIRPELRVGVSLGEVVVADGTLTGSDVVLAQRLEQIASSGGICLSAAVRQVVPDRLPLDYEDLGEQAVKGFAELVQVYAVALRPGEDIPAPEPLPATGRWIENRHGRWVVGGAIALLLIVIGVIAWWQPWESSQMDDLGIAVLPFKNLSEDPSQTYLAEAIAEDITTELSRFKGLLVISRESAFSFRDKEMSAQQIGAELGIRYLLEGSVQRIVDRVRVNVQLIDTQRNSHVWAEKYDRDLTDVLVVQDEIVRSVTTTLGEKIWQSAAATLGRKPIEDFDAYDFELKGREALHKFTLEQNREARRLYHEAIKLDPGYNQVYVGLAWTYVIEYILQWQETGPEVLDEAYEITQQAADTGASGDKVLRLLSRISNLRGEDDKALDQITSAIELNPNDGDLLATKAMYLTFAGRSDEAMPFVDEALRRNPRDFPVWYASVAASTFYLRSEYRRAISVLNRLQQPSVRASRLLAASHAQLGETAEAKKYVDKVLAVSPNFTLARYRNKLPYRVERDAEHFIEGLRKAGFPD